MAYAENVQSGDRSHVSWFSEYTYERRGSWFREVTLDFCLNANLPQGGAHIAISCEIPAQPDDPRVSEVIRKAHAVALEHLHRALALCRHKISEDAFKDGISRQSHLVARELLLRALRLAREKAGDT